MIASVAALLAAAAAICPSPKASAQARYGWSRRVPVPPLPPEFPGDQFTFCRVRYYDRGVSHAYNAYGRWSIDYPESDLNFSQRLSELTTINVSRDPDGGFRHAVVELTDDALFDYPFIYMLEVGALEFSDEEVTKLRSYLLRGGFLMVDDFWGEAEWANWEYEISRVFPPEEYPMVELPLSHPIFNCVFVLREKPQIPSLNVWRGARRTYERYDAQEPHYLGIHDKNGRLMVVVCHNTDLGDGWERETYDYEYFREFSAKKAYPLGINIVVYAMTH